MLTRVLGLTLILACPAACGPEGERSSDGPAVQQGRVLVLAMDGMDHGIVSRMLQRGELPQLAALAREGGFGPLQTTTPPQSPVAWSSFITGMNPGHHGIFDFVQRDPRTLLPYLSTSRVEPPSQLTLGSLALPLGPARVELLRLGRPFWWYLSQAKVPATLIKMPAHFPPCDDGEARVLTDMGTPDLLGTYGTFTLLTSSPSLALRQVSGGRIVQLTSPDGSRDHLTGLLKGPAHPLSARGRPLALPVEVFVDRESRGALVSLGERRLVLAQGEWSELFRIEFSVVPGLYTLPAIVRLYLKSVSPELVLYVSPLNIDPTDPALPISSPAGFARELAGRAGLFYTQGMPEDTKALSSGLLSPAEFLHQAHLIFEQRARMFKVALEQFEQGLLFLYFSTSDQVTHMFFRAFDRTHPARTASDDPFATVIEDVYRDLDAQVGLARKKLGPRDLLLVMSDHGFGPAAYQFGLNTWLVRQGYQSLRAVPTSDILGQIDWSRTQAYGIGLNGLYLNLRGREAHGIVPPARREQILARIGRALLELSHPQTGRRIVTEVVRPDVAYRGGQALKQAPDLLVGYGRGFKVSDTSALGGQDPELVQVNHSAWSGDHCGDPRLVPGILFSSRPLREGPYRLTDLAPTILRHLGQRPPPQMRGRGVLRQ